MTMRRSTVPRNYGKPRSMPKGTGPGHTGKDPIAPWKPLRLVTSKAPRKGKAAK